MKSPTTRKRTGSALAAVSFRLEPEKHARLKLIAAAGRRSVSQEMAWLVDRRIEEYDALEAAA